MAEQRILFRAEDKTGAATRSAKKNVDFQSICCRSRFATLLVVEAQYSGKAEVDRLDRLGRPNTLYYHEIEAMALLKHINFQL